MDILFKDAIRNRNPSKFSIMAKPAGPGCNLNCTYCYYLEKKNLFKEPKITRLSEDLLENFIKQYIETQEIPFVNFTWQGGEPSLLGLNYFKNVIELQRKHAQGKKIENAFQTNGTMLNDEWCRFFADNKILVGISIDGEEHIHNHYRKTNTGGPSFKMTMRGIELLHKHKVDFNTLSCVNSYNVHFASETYRFLKQIGSGFIQIIPIVERIAFQPQENGLNLVSPDFGKEAETTHWSVNGKDFGKFLITIFNEWIKSDVARHYVQIFDATLANYIGENPGICVFSETCGDALVMEHNGDVYSCDHFVYPENFLGNITGQPLIEMARSQKQFDFGIDKRNSLPEFCLKCDVRYACQGECPKHRIIYTPDGSPGLNYLCEGYKNFFHHVEPYMEFMANELKNKRAPANVMNWVKKKNSQIVIPVQPDRNSSCPCGSGKKFKHCCLVFSDN